MSLIDCVYLAEEKMNIQLSATGDKVKVIEGSHIPSVVELYRSIYADLSKSNCGKFIHSMNKDQIEELVESKSSAIIGYFKEGKHLAGAIYTKPFEKTSPFFQTPIFEGDKTTYAIGGLVVTPEYRGNGVVSKITKTIIDGIGQYAQEDKSVAGAGFEISCENFSSMRALGSVKTEEQQPMFNFAGIHYLQQPKAGDSDLTVLGYASFEQDPVSGLYLPQVEIDANQEKSFSQLGQAVQSLGEQAEGSTLIGIDGHNIEMLNTYIQAPINSVITYNPVFASTYPPDLGMEK